MRARVCECVCLIASLLFFSSLPVRLPASVPHPRSLTHRQRGRARETHTHSHTHAHAHAGYMNGRREPILRGWVSRGAQALGAGPHHGAGGRHAGDKPPPAATHQPLGSPESLLSPMSFSRLPLPLLLVRFFLYLLFSFLSRILQVLSVQYFSRSPLTVLACFLAPFLKLSLSLSRLSLLPLLLPFVLFPPSLAFSPVSL